MSDTDYALPALERVAQTPFLAVTWTFTCLSFWMVVMRMTIRIRCFKKIYADDYLVIAAWLILLTSACLWQNKISVMYWMYDIQTGRKVADAAFIAAYGDFLPLIVAWNTLFYSCLWAVKVSFLLFFRRLGSIVIQNRIWWWVVFVITIGGWICCIADIDWTCSTSEITWIMQQCILKKHVLFDDGTFYGNMAVDVFTDILILTIPFRMLWPVRIPLKKKLMLFGIFSLTVIIMVIAIIRVVLVKGVNPAVRVSSMDWLYFWSNIEAGVAIIVACLASFRQLFVHNTQQGLPEKPRSKRSWTLRSLLGLTNLSTKRSDRSLQDPKWSSYEQHPGAGESVQHIGPVDSVYIQHRYDVTSSQYPPAAQHGRDAQPAHYDCV